MKKLFFILLISGFAIQDAAAKTITVSSIADLQNAISKTVPGDNIIVTAGVYKTSADITIDRQGTKELPITIAAQTLGGVEIKGSGGFVINSPAKYIIIKGF